MPAKSDELERARRVAARRLQGELDAAVATVGFTRSKGLCRSEVAPGIGGWLALQVKRDKDTFSVYPNVGVRHEELHRIIDQLYGRKPGNEPTLVCMLGYLMPQATANIAWEFSRHDDPHWTERAANLAAHVLCV
jgi:hypothetical protein